MEQINGGMLEALKLMTINQAAKINKGLTGEEGEFAKMLENRTEEIRAERPAEDRKTEPAEKNETEPMKSEKAASDKKEEEDVTCDVAREAAVAQIVWIAPQDMVEPAKVQKEPATAIIPTDYVAKLLAQEANQKQTILTPYGDPIPPETYDAVMRKMATGKDDVVLTPEPTVTKMVETAEAEVNADNAPLEVNVQNEAEVEVNVETTGDETGGEAVMTETPVFREVEAAPIKVAEAPRGPEEPQNVEKQVADKMVNVLESGETRVEIQLTPESLGKVTVELTKNADGSLNVLLSAESANTRGLLEKNMTGLQEALANRGQQTVQVSVDRGEEAQRQENQQQNFSDGGRNDQPQRQRQQQESHGDDFVQQLRLGLIPTEET